MFKDAMHPLHASNIHSQIFLKLKLIRAMSTPSDK